MSNSVKEEESVEKGASSPKEEENEKEEEDTDSKSRKAEKEEKKKPKIDAADWPLYDIKEPHANDVLYGRGGGTNHHPGNKRYRKMVDDRKVDYVNSKRLDKPMVAFEIIRSWRGQDPPGRFLKLNEATGLWSDVGDKKAREKTSQALREKAPLVRKQQEEEKAKEEGGESDEGEQKERITRFAEGTKKSSVKKPVFLRDHSLGRECIQGNEPMSVEGFSFEDPVGDIFGQKSTNSDSIERPTIKSQPPPPVGTTSTRSYPDPSSMRYESWKRGSFGELPAPPPPSYPTRSDSFGRDHSLAQNPLREASITRPAMPFEDNRWRDHPPPMTHGGFSYPSSVPPPTAPLRSPATSGSIPPPPPPPNVPPHPRRSPVASGPSFPPRPDMPNRPDSGMFRTGSGQYSFDPAVARAWSGQADDYERVGQLIGEESGFGDNQDRLFGAAYPIDRAHNNGESRLGDQLPSRSSTGFTQDRHNSSGSSGGLRGKRMPDSTGLHMGQPSVEQSLSRPGVVKRATSHQNENNETKRTVKRTALMVSRDTDIHRGHSLSGNRLDADEASLMHAPLGVFDDTREMNSLQESLRQSSLGSPMPQPPKPPTIGPERMTTLDKTAAELFKPGSLSDDMRSTTFDLFSEELSNEIMSKPGPTKFDQRPPAVSLDQRTSTVEYMMNEFTREMKVEKIPKKQSPKRPATLTTSNRLSTVDAIDQAFGFGELLSAPVEEV